MTPKQEKMTSIPEKSDINCGGGRKRESRLSFVSTMYDLDGKGYLDETEQQLRDLDTENTGQLSNEKVLIILNEQLQAQRDLYKTRRILFGVSVFAVILALTTLGTAFAAAELAKDSSVKERTSKIIDEEELMSKDGTVAIGVHTIGHEIQLKQHDHGGGIADHACVSSVEVAKVWEEIASEFEVHLILKKYDMPIVTKDHKFLEEHAADVLQEKMLNEELIPLTGAKSSGKQLCFTSFNEIAACVAFNDTACSDELGDDNLVTMVFPNSRFV